MKGLGFQAGSVPIWPYFRIHIWPYFRIHKQCHEILFSRETLPGRAAASGFQLKPGVLGSGQEPARCRVAAVCQDLPRFKGDSEPVSFTSSFRGHWQGGGGLGLGGGGGGKAWGIGEALCCFKSARRCRFRFSCIEY